MFRVWSKGRFSIYGPWNSCGTKPGLGKTEPVSHSTFSNHKREHVAQERPAGAEFCFVKTRYGRLGGSVH